MDIPLADRIRPTNLKDIVGQNHLVGNGKLLHLLSKKSHRANFILWGPSGSGKTTLARIIAVTSQADFIEISAVTSGMADVRKVVERAKNNQKINKPTILFVDEIHRFNKAQQDAFLPHIENGLITLIGATTENPSFEIIKPLLSRTRVIVLEPHSKNDLVTIITRAAKEQGWQKRLTVPATDLLAELAQGDARIALNNLELAAKITNGQITATTIKTAIQKNIPNYDKNGENHYDTISAFIKSLRGSDANASLYYLARMLQASEDPKFIARRMIIFASEDIGLAGNGALSLAVATFQAIERVGMPECQYMLFHCTIALAKSAKSRVVANAMSAANNAAKQYPNEPVPLHVRNAPTKLMKDLGYQKDYQWEENFVHPEGFLPQKLKDFRAL